MNASANAHRLESKIAVVTGAASGIGRATAELFAREGGVIWILDQDEEQGRFVSDEIRRGGGVGHFLRLDVADPQQVQRAAETLLRKSGRVDVLCNCAGVRTSLLPVIDLPVEAWDQILNVNLRGTFLVCKYLVPLMVGGGGTIVNIASIGGLVAWTRNAPAYCASKGGVVAPTRAMAVDHAGQGIRVNCICPGVIETPLTKSRLQEPEYRTRMIRHTPMGRLGQPLEVAYAALFLASGESSFVTGQTLVVDGGWTAE